MKIYLVHHLRHNLCNLGLYCAIINIHILEKFVGKSKILVADFIVVELQNNMPVIEMNKLKFEPET